jgi:hypothetical protein
MFDGGCVYQQTNQSALMKEKPRAQKKEIGLHQ